MASSIWLLGLGWPAAGSGLPHAFPTPFDGVVTLGLMVSFYAFGEWAHQRQVALRREKIVPFPSPADPYPPSS